MPELVNPTALAEFDRLLGELPRAGARARPPTLQRLLALADHLLETEAGLEALAERGGALEEAGFFRDTAWADPSRLLPPLVRSGLLAAGATGTTEALSELRMLAIALGRARSERASPEEAVAFLEATLVLCLDLLFPLRGTEASRAPSPARRRAERVCALLGRAFSLEGLLGVLTVEVDQVLSQRQIQLDRVHELLDQAERVPLSAGRARPERLERFLRARSGPTPLSRRHRDPGAYRAALRELGEQERRVEARALGLSLRTTGLACPQHAVLLAECLDQRQTVELALRLNAPGQVELARQQRLFQRVVREFARPDTAPSLYGLARVLEAGLLSRPEVEAGLRRLFALELAPSVAERLRARFGAAADLRAQVIAGALSVLGQPLGLGQGNNPTCQSARGLSLWAQLAPGHLLAQLACAARADRLELLFEGELLSSADLCDKGLARELDHSLDAASLLLVPHLDRIYDAMMERTAARAGDGHRWVNPALYGPWVGARMAAVCELEFRELLRRFYASHHPVYSGHYGMIHPTPVGLFVTDSGGRLLGRHAVTLQRVRVAPQGEVRAYFFNPNNDSRQDWGQGIVVEVDGHGELEGEGSLPFAQFASRLYAFHYTLYEEPAGAAVPEAELLAVEQLARESWGRAFAPGEARFGPGEPRAG